MNILTPLTPSALVAPTRTTVEQLLRRHGVAVGLTAWEQVLADEGAEAMQGVGPSRLRLVERWAIRCRELDPSTADDLGAGTEGARQPTEPPAIGQAGTYDRRSAHTSVRPTSRAWRRSSGGGGNTERGKGGK